ncbi:hypothetical protein [Bradyrhizobium sp. RT9a]|uniref:hypothetical protein n=1 Tax=Bradyrhizobium sp. RT9a TaxID=3156384 RepID=UPI0033985185
MRKLLTSYRASMLALPVGLALVLAALFGMDRLQAQNAGQFQFTVTGKELVQIIPPNTAAIAYTSVSSLRDGRMWLYNVPLTGFTVTMTVDQSVVSLNPAGTLATGTIVFPPTVVDGKTVSIFSSQTITALTLSTSNSATFAPAAVTTLAANASLEYVYDLANNQWHRFQ